MAGKATRYVRDATPQSLSIASSSTQSFRLLSLALIMASATPVPSEGSTRISARAARGVRGLHHETESPHVADAGIAAQRSGSASRSSSLLLAYRSCSPLGPGGHYIPPRACAQLYLPPSLSVMHRPIIPEVRHTQECPLPRCGKRKAMLLAKVFQIWAFCHSVCFWRASIDNI